MPKRSSTGQGSGPEDYGKILEAFEQQQGGGTPSASAAAVKSSRSLGNRQKEQTVPTPDAPLPRQRKSSFRRSTSAPLGATKSSPTTPKSSVHYDKRLQDEQPEGEEGTPDGTPRMKNTTIVEHDDSSSDDDDEDDDLSDHLIVGVSENESMEARNQSLMRANKRLQERVWACERRLAALGAVPAKEDAASHEAQVVAKLKGKVRSLKMKRRAERVRIVQTQKDVEAHSAEIESLQKELNRTMTELEQLQKDRIQDKSQLAKLSSQLGQAAYRMKEMTACDQERAQHVVKLEADLQRRNDELEVTLELLQGKVERIIQLEYELEQTKGAGRGETKHTGDSSNNLKEAEGEVKKLKRQNMMLKLLVEELEDRKQGGGNGMNPAFTKMPPRARDPQRVRSSPGLRAEGFGVDNDDDIPLKLGQFFDENQEASGMGTQKNAKVKK